MAARNIKTRNLSSSIKRTSASILDEYLRNARSAAHDLAEKRVTRDYALEQAGTQQFVDRINGQAKRAHNNVNATEDAYRELLQKRLNFKPGDATEELLAETRATKTWARIERDIAGKPVADQLDIIATRIQAAVKTGDQGTLAGINSEAPHYLRSVGVKDADDVIEAVIRAHDPEIANAHADIIEARKLRDIANHNAQIITQEAMSAVGQGLPSRIEDPSHFRSYVDPDTAINGKHFDANEALKEVFRQAAPEPRSSDTSNPEAELDEAEPASSEDDE